MDYHYAGMQGTTTTTRRTLPLGGIKNIINYLRVTIRGLSEDITILSLFSLFLLPAHYTGPILACNSTRALELSGVDGGNDRRLLRWNPGSFLNGLT